MDKRKYYALLLGVLMVVLLAGGTILQATYGLEGDWSLEMSINSMNVNTFDVWPGEAIRVEGDAENGYDFVLLSVDNFTEPTNPYGVIIDKTQTGHPAIGVSLGSFTQPVAVIDSTSIPGSKIYTWSFMGEISIQTFASIMVVDEYLIKYAAESVNSTEVAELGTNNLDIDVDFSIIGGVDAVGTCEISNVSVTDMRGMVDSFGVLADYEYTSGSFKIPTLNSLEATVNRPTTGHADVNIVGDIAAGAEVFQGDMILYNAISTYEVSFEVVQVVGELDTARFGVPTILNFLPTSADAILEDHWSFYWVAIVVVVAIVIFMLVSYVYGKPTKP